MVFPSFSIILHPVMIVQTIALIQRSNIQKLPTEKDLVSTEIMTFHFLRYFFIFIVIKYTQHRIYSFNYFYFSKNWSRIDLQHYVSSRYTMYYNNSIHYFCTLQNDTITSLVTRLSLISLNMMPSRVSFFFMVK